LENSHFSFRLLRKRPFCVVECSWIFSALCFRFFTTKPNHHRWNVFFPCFCGLHFVFQELLCSFWPLNTHFKVSNWINSLAVRFINFLNAAFVCCLLKLWKSTAVYSVALVSLYAIDKLCVCVPLERVHGHLCFALSAGISLSFKHGRSGALLLLPPGRWLTAGLSTCAKNGHCTLDFKWFLGSFISKQMEIWNFTKYRL